MNTLNVHSAVFISDLHLADDTPLLLAQWRRFCMNLDPARTEWLIIMGDLFEAYCGDDDDSAINVAVEAVLVDLHRRGIRVALMHGNRDFVIRDGFAKRCHAVILQDPCVLNGHTVLSHGDRYCTRDGGYQTFRQASRQPAWQAAFLSQSLSVRQAQVQAYRLQSKSAQMDVNNADTDAVAEAFISEVQALACDTVIHGHTHRPCDERVSSPSEGSSTIRRVVLGDWQTSGTLAHVAELHSGVLYLIKIAPYVAD